MVTNYLALDVGTVRIGMARANGVIRIAEPLAALLEGDSVIDDIRRLASEHHVTELIVGWPRNLAGQETAQTHYVATFIDRLTPLGMVVHKQDEAATSLKAEAELRRRGAPYAKGDIDSLSAVYILEDYLQESAL